MNAIILAGGFGTRLNSISGGLPKSLMPIGNGVFLDVLIERILSQDISKIFLSVHYKSKLFFDYLKQRDFSQYIEIVEEETPLGTGGAIKNVLKEVDLESPFFVVNGDSLSNVNMEDMYKRFSDLGIQSMIGLSYIDNASRYGSVEFQEDIVTKFKEKENSFSSQGSWINNGFYLFEKNIFLDYSGRVSLEKNILTKLAEDKKLFAYKTKNDCFIDIGIPSDYYKLYGIYKDKLNEFQDRK
jgi:D-glycero-alpha-D-manno-heptose 1-phosphate guanylyltransferase